MAVFQGTRLRTVALPARSPRQRSARVVTQAPAHTAPRLRPTGLLMAAILTATMLGLVYLTQTLASNAAGVEVSLAKTKADDLQRRIANQSSLIELRTDADELIERARGQGLVLLDDSIILKAP